MINEWNLNKFSFIFKCRLSTTWQRIWWSLRCHRHKDNVGLQCEATAVTMQEPRTTCTKHWLASPEVSYTRVGGQMSGQNVQRDTHDLLFKDHINIYSLWIASKLKRKQNWEHSKQVLISSPMAVLLVILPLTAYSLQFMLTNSSPMWIWEVLQDWIA